MTDGMKLNHRQRRHANKIFEKALKQAGFVESGIKKTVCAMPFFLRVVVAWKILRKTWR